jgi:hypothetical protein
MSERPPLLLRSDQEDAYAAGNAPQSVGFAKTMVTTLDRIELTRTVLAIASTCAKRGRG